MSESLLIPDKPLQVLPKLAKALGLNQAIVLQQVYWLQRDPNNGKEVEGKRWIYNTYPEWQKSYFPFWSVDTIMRIFNELEQMFMLDSIQPEGRASRRKYYAINVGGISKLTTTHFPDTDNLPPSEPDNLPASSLYTKKTQRRQRVLEDKKTDFPPNLDLIRDVWNDWVQHRREKKIPVTPTSERLQLKRLSLLGPERARVAIEHSIAAGYTGLFEPSGNHNKEPVKPKRPYRDVSNE